MSTLLKLDKENMSGVNYAALIRAANVYVTWLIIVIRDLKTIMHIDLRLSTVCCICVE